MNSKDNYSFYYRVMIIGNMSVGKTSLLNQLTEGSYNNKYKATLGVDFRTKEVTIDSDIVKLEIWDTAGQERFRSLTMKYYQRADGVIISFSVDDSQSFQLVESWMKGARDNTSEASFILAGCKCDIDTSRVVSKEEALMFAVRHNLQYIETSAKTNTNVLLLFEEIARLIKAKKGSVKADQPLTLSNEEKKKKGCCG